MTATAAQIAQVRRMTAEPTTTTYTDVAIQGYIETYPMMDERGELPYTWSGATPPAKVTNTAWVATYDLNSAAADIWQEKAACLSVQYDYRAGASGFDRSQLYEQAMKQVRHYRARRATTTMRGVKEPRETGNDKFPWIGNLPEVD